MSEPKTHIEVIAPTVAEAIEKGAAELGLPPDALDVEVLDEGSRGFLGLGGRQARVRLTLRQEPTQTPAAPTIPTKQPMPQVEGEEQGDPQAVEVVVATVRELLERMHINAQVEARWGPRPPAGEIWPLFVDISGKDLSILIGRKGETLSALQYITRIIVGKELQRQVAVVIDVEGYRARREHQLRRLARRMAQQAVERGRTMVLEPMPAHERRIIHLELRDHQEVRTESVGEGERRKVTIIPTNPRR